MLFNSFEFLLFFPLVTVLFFLLPHRYRWFHLLAASCIFYMMFIPIYILILFFTIIIDYFAGILIENAPENRKRPYLILSLVANIGVLAFFKYYNFFIDNVNELLGITQSSAQLPLLAIILPIGLSFHTFQAMSYTIEVYRGNQKAERHFGIYSLYVMFYPQLVAGPIERPQNMLHQFHEKYSFDKERVMSGLQLMLWGFFKKIVIADRMAMFVDQVYDHSSLHAGTAKMLATLFFTIQIYCDFSGYSDIAIGSARVMGFKLMNNFNIPYVSKNVSEFWKRWHISLSTWFNDYLFNPIVTARRDWGRFAVVFAILCTFLTSGLWHGAAWTFIIWGALHGLALVLLFLTTKFRKKISKPLPGYLWDTLGLVTTFLFVCFTFIFFRANKVKEAFSIAGDIFSRDTITGFFHKLPAPFDNARDMLFILGLVVFMFFYENRNLMHKREFHKSWAGFVVAASLIWAIFIWGAFNNKQFIYFQF
jgi:alginate O-acetyltransferase complex protein AlgI